MRQLVYISCVARVLKPRDIDAIVAVSSRRNAEVGVTGLLVFDGYRFIQALEGPERAVAAVMDRISRDPRHRSLAYMPVSDVPERQFGSWSMHAKILTAMDETQDFFGDVSALLKNVSSPDILAAFIGFASMSRARHRRQAMPALHRVGALTS